MQTPISILTPYLARWKEGGGEGGDRRIPKGSMSSIDSIGDRFVFNGCFPEWHRTTRIETGTIHPEDVVALGWPILLLPIFRSVARACENVPRSLASFSTEKPLRVARRLRADVSAFTFRAHFSYDSHLSSLLSLFVILSLSFNISKARFI